MKFNHKQEPNTNEEKSKDGSDRKAEEDHRDPLAAAVESVTKSLGVSATEARRILATYNNSYTINATQTKPGTRAGGIITSSGHTSYTCGCARCNPAWPPRHYSLNVELRFKPELEQIQEIIPILAHRAAGLVIDPTDDKPFASLNRWRTSSFGVDATAICQVTPHPYHKSTPDLWCTCGFYGVPASKPTMSGWSTIDLLVEFSGRVIEHQFGYRAEHQRVLEAYVPQCWMCWYGKVPNHWNSYATFAVVMTYDDNDKRVFTRFLCDAHMDNQSSIRKFISFDDIRKTLPVPLIQRDDSDKFKEMK